MPLILHEANVQQLLTMQDAMEAVEAAFRDLHRGSAEDLGRRRILTASGSLSVMGGALPSVGTMGVKAYTAFGNAGARHLFLLYRSDDGALVAIIEADHLGRIRTGAATGLATRHLARPDASRLGIIGTGVQAWPQVQAIASVRQLEEVKVYSRSANTRADFAKRIRKELKVSAFGVATARDAVQDVDIVTTVTTAADPVVLGEWLASGTHVNAIGSNWEHKREVDDSVVARSALVVVDAIAQAQREAGDLIQPARRGLLDWERVWELSTYVAGEGMRRQPDDITLYKSVGIAIEDVAVASRVYALAVQEGVGVMSLLAGD